MKNSEPSLTYAIDKATGHLVSVTDVSNGESCNCICPECKEPLIARQGKHNTWSFAHSKDSQCNPHKAFESMIHILSKEIIYEQKAIATPDYIMDGKIIFQARILQFAKVEIERKDDQSNLRPDCIGHYINKNDIDVEIWIEINNTHSVDEIKHKYLQDKKIYCIEIDVNQFNNDEFSKETLTKYLLHDFNPFCRRWVNYPITIKETNPTTNTTKFINRNHQQYDLVRSKRGGWSFKGRKRF